MSARRIKIDDGRKVILVGKKLSKVISLTWFERLGRAVLDGATPEDIEALREEHFSPSKTRFVIPAFPVQAPTKDGPDDY